MENSFFLFDLHLHYRASLNLQDSNKASPQGRADEKNKEALNIGPAEGLICPSKTDLFEPWERDNV
jgi:hypothetical protein